MIKSIVKHSVVHIVFVLLLAFFIITGLLGLDYGRHPDEGRITRSVSRMAGTGVLISAFYDYPSFCYYVGLLGLAPEIVGYANPYLPNYIGNKNKPVVSRLIYHEKLKQFANDVPFTMRLRVIFICLSGLTLLWIYLAVYKWQKNWLEALLAAALVGLSWEMSYHSRWVTTDPVLMQFGALTLLFLVLAQTGEHRGRWLNLAAITAGIGCGTKYPGGLLIVPVLIAAYDQVPDKKNVSSLIKMLMRKMLIFTGAYLVTTPGTIYNPITFIAEALDQARIYSQGHYGHTVRAFTEHLPRLLVYLSAAVFSHNLWISFFFTLMTLAGIFSLFRQDRKMAMIAISFPMVYLLYMSSQRVMFIRNYLVFIPFLALLSARGCFFWGQKVRKRYLRILFAFVLTGLLCLNGVWVFESAMSIKHKNRNLDIATLVKYINQQSDKKFILSSKIKAETASSKFTSSNLTDNPAEKNTFVVFYRFEVPNENDWLANRLNYFTAKFGPDDINLDYYPGWPGADHIVVLPVEKARRLKLPVLAGLETK